MTEAYCHLFRPQRPRPEPRDESEPRRQKLLAVEERLADARRAISRARQLGEPRFRDQLIVLEDLVQLLGREVLREAQR